MNHNVGNIDRALRFILGVLLLTWAIAGGPFWTFVGIFFLFTGSFGLCPVYWFLRINSGP